MDTQVQMIERLALSTGRTALEKFGPAAAVAAMKPWAERYEKAQAKAERRAT